MIKHISILLILTCLVQLNLQAQSPWARPRSGAYAQLSWNFIPTYTTLFGVNGEDLNLEREVTERSLQFYAEYGLSKKTTLIVSAPLVMNQRGAPNPNGTSVVDRDAGQITGPGNTTLALKHQFLQGKLALSGTFRMDFPVARKNFQTTTGLTTGYNALTLLPSAQVGMGLGKVYWFAYGGYGYRSNEYSHFLNFGAELGLRLGKVWLAGFSETIYPLENGARQLPEQSVLTGLYVNDQGWISLGLKAIWEIKPSFGINFSGAGAAWAQNVPKSPGVSLGAYFKWDGVSK